MIHVCKGPLTSKCVVGIQDQNHKLDSEAETIKDVEIYHST